MEAIDIDDVTLNTAGALIEAVMFLIRKKTSRFLSDQSRIVDGERPHENYIPPTYTSKNLAKSPVVPQTLTMFPPS